ncbi:RING finger protein 223 [Stigmatopora argus]
MAGEPSPAPTPTPTPTPAPTPTPTPTPAPTTAPTPPDLECRVCYSRFNNVFQCPKMLECKHTFCLECLARINVKSARPAAIRCPLCRHPTPLPAPDLSRLATDARVLASLPAAMRRAHSVRFYRGEGKLHIQRVSRGQAEPGETQLDISLPEVPIQRAGGAGAAAAAGSGLGHASESESGLGLGRAGRSVCRALLLVVVLLMSAVLAGIIFLLTFDLKNL